VEPLRLGKLLVHQVAEEAPMPLAHEATFAGRGHRKSLHQTEAKVRRL